jgi:SAM-dependent methyltransferase
MKSPYIISQQEEEQKAFLRDSLYQDAIQKFAQVDDAALPPLSMMNIIGSYNRDHFCKASLQFFTEFFLRGQIEPNHNILDIGSGCGRLAIPFEFFTKSGAYYGVDVWKEGIEWCQENISVRSPNFIFKQILAENNYYADEFDPKIRNSFDLAFIGDDSINFAFAVSVFTHLVVHDCELYFKELSRVLLKKNGIAYITAFIIDDFFWSYVEESGNHSSVRMSEPGCFYAYRGQDFFAGYSMPRWIEMLAGNGLEIVCYETGTWAKKPGARMYQDTFIIVPKRQLRDCISAPL